MVGVEESRMAAQVKGISRNSHPKVGKPVHINNMTCTQYDPSNALNAHDNAYQRITKCKYTLIHYIYHKQMEIGSLFSSANFLFIC
jgi:Pyruvate/2-oxoacid:ferredoxin oxidoreductase delta subunit